VLLIYILVWESIGSDMGKKKFIEKAKYPLSFEIIKKMNCGWLQISENAVHMFFLFLAIM
jgi:hypothetical protein